MTSDPGRAAGRRAPLSTDARRDRQAAATVAAATSVSAVADLRRRRASPSRSATAVRNSSRRRTARTRGDRLGRVVVAPGRREHLGDQRGRRPRGSQLAVVGEQPTASGARSSRSVAYRLEASTRGQPLGDGAVVAQQPRYHGVVPSASLTCRKPSSPASGSGASANQPSITGSSVRWIAARRLTPAVSASMWRSAPVGVGVAERLEPVARRPRVQPRLAGVEPGDRVEQRPVEELLVQPAHLARVPPPLRDQLVDRVVPEAHRAREPAQVGLVVGHDVGAAQPVQLEPVLQRAQEAVGAVELGGVVAADVPVRRQLLERLQRGAGCGRRRRCGRARAAAAGRRTRRRAARRGPSLSWRSASLRGDVLLDPAAHRLDVVDEVRSLRRRVHTSGATRVDVRRARARGRRRPAAP